MRLPEEIDFVTASSLGCRFVTTFRAVVDKGEISGGDWLAVHGCGGVGLSAIMIADAFGANVVAINIDNEKLEFAKSIGAVATVNSNQVENVVEAVMKSPAAERTFRLMPWDIRRPVPIRFPI